MYPDSFFMYSPQPHTRAVWAARVARINYYDALTQLLLEGKTVTTPATNYPVSIRGNSLPRVENRNRWRTVTVTARTMVGAGLIPASTMRFFSHGCVIRLWYNG